VAISELAADKVWLKKQGAAEIATLFGVKHDKAVRMIEALNQSEIRGLDLPRIDTGGFDFGGKRAPTGRWDTPAGWRAWLTKRPRCRAHGLRPPPRRVLGVAVGDRAGLGPVPVRGDLASWWREVHRSGARGCGWAEDAKVTSLRGAKEARGSLFISHRSP
jgi:hypothetical protein